jgi:fibronectin type 3 domain-containing protein
MSVEPMKRLFTTCMVLGCLSFSFAQGLQGNVKLSGKTAVTVTGHSVTLTWNASQNATSYNIYRGTTAGGPYTRLASGIVSTTYTDVQVTHNQTLYYVITAVNGNNESGYSSQTAAVIP